jgi:hypothetical protein
MEERGEPLMNGCDNYRSFQEGNNGYVNEI